MTFSAYIQKILGSSRDDWNVLPDPPLLHHFASATPTAAGQQHPAAGVEHPSYAMAFRPDLAISVVTGIVCAPTFANPWASAFGDAHTEYLLLFYNSTAVYRSLYVSVDNERCWLPLPKAGSSAVPRPYHDLVGLLNALTRQVPYEEYVQRAGLKVVDEPWPD